MNLSFVIPARMRCMRITKIVGNADEAGIQTGGWTPACALRDAHILNFYCFTGDWFQARNRRSREGGSPQTAEMNQSAAWVPAFAGTTKKMCASRSACAGVTGKFAGTTP